MKASKAFSLFDNICSYHFSYTRSYSRDEVDGGVEIEANVGDHSKEGPGAFERLVILAEGDKDVIDDDGDLTEEKQEYHRYQHDRYVMTLAFRNLRGWRGGDEENASDVVGKKR